MRLKHVIIEIYCDRHSEKNSSNECKDQTGDIGYDCLVNCPNVMYAPAPYEIAYAGENGNISSPDFRIGFGGDMTTEEYDEKIEEQRKQIWENICKKKIKEAYEEYMIVINKENESLI